MLHINCGTSCGLGTTPLRAIPLTPPIPAPVQVLNQFLEKSDGRDKLLAALQYAAMFVAAGQPGDAKRVQASVAAARKVFRIMKVGGGCRPRQPRTHARTRTPPLTRQAPGPAATLHAALLPLVSTCPHCAHAAGDGEPAAVE